MSLDRLSKTFEESDPHTLLRRWLVAAAWVYFTFLFGWLILYRATGDRLPYLALANTLAIYLFLPLPLAAAAAYAFRRRELWLGVLLGGAAFLTLWGELFWPVRRPVTVEAPRLTIMTYNVLGHHSASEALFEVIRTEAPDVVLIQELNPDVAGAIHDHLRVDYPHQVLDPRWGVVGMGVISRFPLAPAEVSLPLDWVGTPQVLELNWNGEEVTLVNFHMYPSGLGTPAGINRVYRAREDQARALAALAAERQTLGPVVAGGDANVTDLSDAYRIVLGPLQDAWRDAGFGLGHTFPGSAIPGSARPRLAGVPVPPWLARIDYVFYSPHWQAVSARLAPPDGFSDHRAVLAVLARR